MAASNEAWKGGHVESGKQPVAQAVEQQVSRADSARLGRHRRHHELHEHVEPFRVGGGRLACEERRGSRTEDQAAGEDQPRPGLQSRHRVSEGVGIAERI